MFHSSIFSLNYQLVYPSAPLNHHKAHPPMTSCFDISSSSISTHYPSKGTAPNEPKNESEEARHYSSSILYCAIAESQFAKDRFVPFRMTCQQAPQYRANPTPILQVCRVNMIPQYLIKN